jgi:CRISPR type I-E-associated protein CasB/Cse2
MSPTATEQYIEVLVRLKPGDLTLLRIASGKDIAESVQAFDLFAGMWWPLQNKSQFAPRREVAWLIAKLYAFCPIPHSANNTLAHQLSRCQPVEERNRKRFQERFDALLGMPLDKIETALQWSLSAIAAGDSPIDWARLTNDLSIWEREATRLRWAQQFLVAIEGGNHAYPDSHDPEPQPGQPEPG